MLQQVFISVFLSCCVGISREPAGHAGRCIKCPSYVRGEKQREASEVTFDAFDNRAKSLGLTICTSNLMNVVYLRKKKICRKSFGVCRGKLLILSEAVDFNKRSCT